MMVNPESVENKMTVREIASKGGQTTRDKYGVEHFAKIGAKGRKRTKELIDRGKAQEDDGLPGRAD